MTISAHIARVYDHIDGLWPRTALTKESEKWQGMWDAYCDRLGDHLKWGGRITKFRYITFRMIVRLALERIQNRIDVIDILEGRTPIAPPR